MNLSEDALALLRLRLLGQRREVDDETREVYRELARAGLMYPVSSFARGPEALYRVTDEAWHRREEWLGEHASAALLPQSS